MVRLHTSLLVVALATGSALASFKGFQRRELGDQVQSHGPLSSRLGRAVADFQSRGFVDAFDDLEARTFLSAQTLRNDVARAKSLTSVGNTAARIASQVKHRGLEDDESLLVRDLDDELFGREQASVKIEIAI